MCIASVTSSTRVTPCARSMAALKAAFSAVSREPRSTHCTGTPKSSRRAAAIASPKE